jgi:hypothetical protein
LHLLQESEEQSVGIILSGICLLLQFVSFNYLIYVKYNMKPIKYFLYEYIAITLINQNIRLVFCIHCKETPKGSIRGCRCPIKSTDHTHACLLIRLMDVNTYLKDAQTQMMIFKKGYYSAFSA